MSDTHADDKNPPVTKSESGICHSTGGAYYKRTKNFTSYQTMEECFASSGSKPNK